MSENIFIIVIFALFLALVSVIYNNVITVRKYTVETDREINPLRVVFLADLFSNNHNVRISSIIEKTKKCNPDVIIVSGPSFQNNNREEHILKELSAIAPAITAFSDVTDGNFYVNLKNDEMKIFRDFSVFVCENCKDNDKLLTFSKLDNIKILSVPLPSHFDESVYLKDIDLVLSCHGGGLMVRIPFYGIAYSEKEGFLPEYPSRFYVKNGTALVSTTGVGKSFLPLRINNLREIVCVDIKK